MKVSTTSNGGHWRIVATPDIDLATGISRNLFPAFDPHKDIGVGSFVGMCSSEHESKNGASFYVGKVRALNCIADIMARPFYSPSLILPSLCVYKWLVSLTGGVYADS